MIKQVKLRFGSSKGQPPLQFEPGQMTVFVGPNNSGKSLILREISNYQAYSAELRSNVIRDIQLKSFSRNEARDLLLPLGSFDSGAPSGRLTFSDPLTREGAGRLGNFTIPDIETYLFKVDAKGHLPDEWRVLSLSKLQLDGQTRLSLVNRQQLGNLKEPPKNLLSHLFANDDARNRLRGLLYEALGLYCYVDPTSIPSIRLCFHSEPLPIPNMERSLENTAVTFFKHATPIEQMSDGVKAFTGILAAALSRAYRVILIDEPEAFYTLR